MSVPQEIGRLWAEMISQMKIGTFESLQAAEIAMTKLGVNATDQSAQKQLSEIIEMAVLPNVKITPDPDSTGVYFLSLDGKRFAVFKVGEKRARIELLVRSIAHKVGLEQHCVPGIFCTLAKPKFAVGDTIVELWNGNNKIYENKGNYNREVEDDNFGLEQPYTLTGILEPFVSSETATTVDDFARITCLALLVGLRDGKEDGISGSFMFDVEDCMPARLLPSSSPNKKVAATHLPYLANKLASEPISREVLIELERKISKIPLFSFLTELSREKVEYADLIAETFLIPDPELHNYEKFKHYNTGWDHGGCWITVEAPKTTDDTRSKIELDSSDAKSFRLLSESQLDACAMRITRLGDFLKYCIENNKLPNCIDMARAVDFFYDAHLRALEKQQGRHSPYHVAGLISPHRSARLSEEDRHEILAMCSLSRSNSIGGTPEPPPVLVSQEELSQILDLAKTGSGKKEDTD